MHNEHIHGIVLGTKVTPKCLEFRHWNVD